MDRRAGKARASHRLGAGVALAGAVLLTALAVGGSSSDERVGTARPLPASTPLHCTARGDLPDPRCTPGKMLAGATRAKVCVPGYSASVRPSTSWAHAAKLRVMKRYGLEGRPLAAYQLDHLVPLEVGGAPRAVRNLWPEPIAQAHDKDQAENNAHRLICAGKLTLLVAVEDFMSDWRALIP